jgi:hypothetical protein
MASIIYQPFTTLFEQHLPGPRARRHAQQAAGDELEAHGR